MEPLGKKLQQARLAKNISLEEAARVTKIRQSRIEEIEAEDFSSFPSLAYAKGFVIIYGKFLDVDVTPYLEAFETSDKVTVDGYSYLQGNGGAPPPAPIVRREPAKRPALLPLFIAVGVLVVGLYLVKLFLDIQRITPPGNPAGAPTPTATATPTPVGETIVAPRAIPVETTTPAEPVAETPATPAPETPRQENTPPPRVSPAEQEVRRAIPVGPDELTTPKVTPSPGREMAALATPTPSAPATVPPTPTLTPPPTPPPTATPSPSPPKPSPSPTATSNHVLITPVRKTFVRVIVDNNSAHPAFEGWLTPSDPPLSFRAQRVNVKALEPGAIQITKNGAPVRGNDSNVHIDE